MKRVQSILALVAMLAFSAFADDGSGFYAGAGYGPTAYYDDDLIEEWGGYEQDDDDSGRKIYAGYQFNRIVGVEASYTDYGRFRSTLFDQKFTAVHIAANVGYSFMDGQMRPFFLAGVGHVDHDTDRVPAGMESDDIDFSYYFGYGFLFEPRALGGLGIRIGYEFDLFNREVRDLGYSEDYAQALALWHIALQYRF